MDLSTLISTTVNIIEDNLMDIISINEVSDRLNVSLNYLNRNFKKVIGYTPLDYLKMRKITQGIKNGIEGRGNIIDIAFEYGFNSHEVFIRSCKRYFNKSPREILKNKEWDGCKKIDNTSLWFYVNSDKIVKKKVRLPKLVLKESNQGDFIVHINKETYNGEKSEIDWNPKECYRFIPEGVYISYQIDNNISKKDFLAFLNSSNINSFIIEVYKHNMSLFYIKTNM